MSKVRILFVAVAATLLVFGLMIAAPEERASAAAGQLPVATGGAECDGTPIDYGSMTLEQLEEWAQEGGATLLQGEDATAVGEPPQCPSTNNCGGAGCRKDRFNCTTTDQGYSQCSVPPFGIIYNCTGGTTVHVKICDCIADEGAGCAPFSKELVCL